MKYKRKRKKGGGEEEEEKRRRKKEGQEAEEEDYQRYAGFFLPHPTPNQQPIKYHEVYIMSYIDVILIIWRTIIWENKLINGFWPRLIIRIRCLYIWLCNKTGVIKADFNYFLLII